MEKEKIIEKMLEIFKGVGIHIYDGIVENINIDSLQFVALICEIEESFNIVVPDEYMSFEKLQKFTDFIDMIILLQENYNKLDIIS